MTAELLVLRLVHVLGGIFWVGSGLFTALFLVPALAGVGPAAGQVMGGLQRRRLFTVLPVVALLTIASGLRLMWIGSGGFDAAYFASAPGGTFAASGLAAIAAFLLSLLVSRPAAVRAAGLGAAIAAAPDEARRAALAAQLERTRRRGGLASNAGALLLVLAAGGMAVARYLG
jgi:uncharacterized membrane protein